MDSLSIEQWRARIGGFRGHRASKKIKFSNSAAQITRHYVGCTITMLIATIVLLYAACNVTSSPIHFPHLTSITNTYATTTPETGI